MRNSKQITKLINNLLNNIKSKKKKNKINNPKSWDIIFYLLLLSITICLLYIIYNLVKAKLIKPSEILVNEMKRPFLNIYDDKGNKTNVVFITHPFTRDECIQQYNEAKKNGIMFLGMSSYCEFPGIISNPHDILHDPNIDAWKKYNYFDLTEGWCHCFREPNKYIKNNKKPITLISESDFAKYDNHKPDDTIEKKYDFLYVCLKDNDKCEDGWQSYNRNWQVAKKCLDIMCEKYNLKGLLVGRINCEIPKGCHQLMELTDFMEYNKFIKSYNQCKFVFVPNIADASPRVLTEALCFNLPALVNYNILGGWKYINEKSGELFVDENDFEKVLNKFLTKLDKKEYNSRQNYIDNFGTKNYGPKLLDFVCKCIPEDKLNFKKKDVTYLKPGI